jgi:hypothetical protein
MGIFCESLYSILLLSAVLGVYFLGRTLSRPQVRREVVGGAAGRGGWRDHDAAERHAC